MAGRREYVGALMAIGAIALGALAWWGRRRKRRGEPAPLAPDLFTSEMFRLGITKQMLQQIAPGGAMIALPIELQMVLEYNALQAGLYLRPALAHHVRSSVAGGEGRRDRVVRAASSGWGSCFSRSESPC